jgi:hypothetical protein
MIDLERPGASTPSPAGALGVVREQAGQCECKCPPVRTI